MTLRDRFDEKWTKVDSGCWEWQAYRDDQGYGTIKREGKTCRAHRVGYELYVGPIPDGLVIDHRCRNTSCVNPRHLEPVTNRVNLLRGNTLQAKNAAKTRCVNGHPFTESNTGRSKTQRYCKACKRERTAQWRKRKDMEANKDG